MAVKPVILNTKPAGPVDFSENAVRKVFATTGWVIADTKEDGVQLNLAVDNSPEIHVDFLSRAGKHLPGLQAAYTRCADTLFAQLLHDDQMIYPQGFMLQGEIVMPGQPAEVTAGYLQRIKADPKKGERLLELDDIEVHVFGVAPLDKIRSGEDLEVTHGIMKYHTELMVALLKKHVPQIKWVVMESLDVFSYEELEGLFQKRREEGKEGLVVKDPNATWRRGKKVGQWKMKPDDTIDGTVSGLVWGTEGLANEGKVIGFEVTLEDGFVVNACGLTEDQKAEFTNAVYMAAKAKFLGDGGFLYQNAEGYANRICPKYANDCNPFKGWSAEVVFMERFEDGSLRHPSFSRFRGISDPMVKE
ncbi:hypothetical protein [Pseudomonas sp. B14(2017)]|uniref:ATP-dependent DNA ligase n=1 Tax=Pseudomonas sp. B14(2017) TaxID=1981745 RepID=UPI000A1DD1AF|nr:hypothetical protein [Pseudomonas sp. B14(2017)]